MGISQNVNCFKQLISALNKKEKRSVKRIALNSQVIHCSSLVKSNFSLVINEKSKNMNLQAR